MTTIKLPKPGKSATKATIISWLKKTGDVISKEEIFLRIESDEGLIDLESGLDGTLETILVPTGKTVETDTPLCEINPGKIMTPESKKEEVSAPPPTGAGGNAANVVPVLMPKAGQSMEEGTIVTWRVKPGDRITKGDIIFEIETDKATVEVEAVDEGRLAKIIVAEGDTIPVLQPVAYLAENDADVDAFLGGSGSTSAGGASTSETQAPAAPSTAPAAVEMPTSITPILMPKAGQSMEEGTIVSWRVKPGDRIKKGDIIFEIETDKATIEVEAVDEGRLSKIVLPEGGTIEVLQPVAYLAENDVDVERYLASSTVAATGTKAVPVETAPVITAKAAVSQPTASEGGRVKASPAARKIAKERGVDLSTVATGSGPGGRILSTDVPAAGAAGAYRPAPAAMPVVSGEGVRKRMSNMRKAIARNLLASKQNIPHFYIKSTIDADPLYRFYKAEKAKYPCSVNDVVVLACAKAIQEFPAFRSQMDNDAIVEFANSNIGVAVGMDEGLVVPVLLGAEQMNLEQISAETKRIANAARGGKIEGMGKGVFTITNLGMFGVEEFSAIINPPEAAILAVGAIREQVIVSNGAMRPGRVMTMTLSADHRIVDGMLAAKFMVRLKEMLESPNGIGEGKS
ncbi:MAG: biotin/lipoyl-binding protein [Phycisphaerae bacterium]|nr:biotin/lipoyl-binding protein [Phycisphaerae bacterium]